MIFEKLQKLFSHYLYKENSEEEIAEFQKQFEVIFDTFRQELQAEVGEIKYELMDRIYMTFDSYEPDENIRLNDKYCIDQKTLMVKIKELYNETTLV